MADTEYLTGNRHTRFPFADDSAVAATAGEDASLPIFGCFVDAMVQLKDPYSTVIPVVKDISVSGRTLSFTLSGDSDIRITCTRTSTLFPVIYDNSAWCWYSFVLSSSGIGELAEFMKSHEISEHRLAFSPRCVGASARGVDSFLIYGGTGTNSSGRRYTLSEALVEKEDFKVTGDVSFVEGYNVEFGTESNRYGVGLEDKCVSMSAGAGLGAGVIVCSEQEKTTFKTPGLRSKDGHVRLFNDTCYDLVPGTSTDGTEGELAVNVKCKACCTCDMYASIVNERLIPLRDKITAAKSSLDKTLATYEYYVEKWNYRISNALPEDAVILSNGVYLDAAATDLEPCSVAGKMTRCGFSLTMRNDSFVRLTYKLNKFTASGDPFESQISYNNDKMEPVIRKVDLTSTNDPILEVILPPGRSAVLSFFVRSEAMVRTDGQAGILATADMTVYQGERLVVNRHMDMSA